MAAPPEAPKALRDTVGGDAVPVEVRDGRLRFVARAIPLLGYRTFVAVPAPAEASQILTASDKTVENEYLRVTVAPERGGISSIIDKRSGRELAGATGDLAIGQYV